MLFEDLEKAVEDADFVIEAVYENLDAKLKVFTSLNQICRPETIIASNTSTLSITSMAKALEHSDRFIGIHFFSPVPVMRLVEVVKGEATSQANTRRRPLGLARGDGKDPYRSQGCPGFHCKSLFGAHAQRGCAPG